MITVLLLSIALGLLLHLIWERSRRMKLFERMGIPGPKPSLLWGNQMDLTEGISIATSKWQKKYGDTFGFFEGTTPVLVTKDLDLIKQVYIKEFSKFTARKRFPFGPEPNATHGVNILVAEGSRWKRFRTMLSPSFTTGKLKQTQPFIMLGIKNLMEVLEEKAKDGGIFNIMALFQAMTLDVISSTAFGLDIDAQRNQNGKMIKACRAAFAQQSMSKMSRTRKILFYLSIMFPSLRFLFFGTWRILNELGIVKFDGYYIVKHLREVIKERKDSGKADRRDILQTLLDAEAPDSVINDHELIMTEDDNESAPKASLKNKPAVRYQKKMTTEEIASNSLAFLLAGYETTSTALSYSAQELAMHPEVQRKLQKEIDKVVGQDRPDHKHLSQMSYLDMVFNEVMRKNTIVPKFITRRAEEEVKIGDYIIPKDLTIQVNPVDIHKDPDIWGPTDPLKFDPERFSPENKSSRNPLAFQVFGTGPRNCIGMRLALMEGKLALISVLQKYTINRCEKTEEVLELMEQGTLVPKNGVHVTLSRRNESEFSD